MKVERQRYTLEAFSVNRSRVIHRTLHGVEVTITLRGVPAVRPVPLGVVHDGAEDVRLNLAAIPGFQVAQLSPTLPMPTLRLSGTGPAAAEMLLQDRQ